MSEVCYTGVGSRETPRDILVLMYRFAQLMAMKDITLRSGGADGADAVFELGCDSREGAKQIFLPWRGFNGRSSQFNTAKPEAMIIAESIHPAWDRCSRGARALHARNVHQVLGWDLNTPSAFVVAWTKNGLKTGGTATAIKIAEQNGIPVFNLFNHDIARVMEWIKTHL